MYISKSHMHKLQMQYFHSAFSLEMWESLPVFSQFSSSCISRNVSHVLIFLLILILKLHVLVTVMN